MRSTRSPAAMACLALAALFTFTSALGQDMPSVLSLDITSYPINPWLVEEASLDAMEPGEFAREFAVESARVRGYQDVFDAVCTKQPGCEEPTLAEIRACLSFSDQILEAVEALRTAQEYYEVTRPQKLRLVVASPAATGTVRVRVDRDSRVRTEVPTPAPAPSPATAPAAGSEPRRGVEDPESSRGESRRGAPAPAPAEEADAMFRFETPGVPGHFMIGMDTLKPDLGTRDAFVVRCAGNGEVWEETLEAAEAADRRAVELTARAKHVVGALRQDESVPQAVAALQTVSRSLTQAVERLNASSRADHAPLAHLWSSRAAKNYGPSSCGELYDFAIGADNRNVAMTVGTSVVALISWHIVMTTDGREAADRHWGFLNRLGGSFLSPPQLPPDES